MNLIQFNAVVRDLYLECTVFRPLTLPEHLVPGGELNFDKCFLLLRIIGPPQNTPALEGEVRHPETGFPMRMYDTRTFARVAQIQHSVTSLRYWRPMEACREPTGQRSACLQLREGAVRPRHSLRALGELW